MPATLTPAAEAQRFHSGREWLDALGGIPMDRVVWDPWPGTATEADLLEFVDCEPKRLVELIDGTLVEKPMGLPESSIASTLIIDLGIWSRQNADPIVVTGGDGTLRMGGYNRIRLPDVSVFLKNRLLGGRLPPGQVPELAPDIAVEVLSPSNTPGEMRQKMAEYFANGTRLVWLIDPRSRTIAVHTAADEPDAVLGEADKLTAADVLPAFEVAVATLFRELPEA
jgi:Uma2 family endonuclease